MNPKINFIIFEVTSLCNNDCLYCYNIWKRPNESNIQYNSYKQALKTLKQIIKNINVDVVTFSGGEPMLAERLNELVLYCRLKKKSVNIITNGSNQDSKKYKELVDLGVSKFILPIHSYNPVTHDKMTRKAGSHSHVIDSIKKLQSMNTKICADIVISKININELGETITYINDLGINDIMLTRYNIGGEGIRNADHLIPDIDSLRNVYSIANSLVREIGVRITSNVCTPYCILNPDDYKQIILVSCSTDISKMPVTFDIFGNMRICNHSPVIIGNIYEKNIEDLINSDYINNWKEIIPDYCIGCNIYNKCFAGCRAASEQVNMGLSHPDPIINYYNNSNF
ncbi:MAG: radical SAM protein [FCB group bacterium]|jgi:radical SAM protein with 4Fe4S-binding SPASM domain